MNEERLRRYLPIVNRAIWLICLIELARASVRVLEIVVLT